MRASACAARARSTPLTVARLPALAVTTARRRREKGTLCGHSNARRFHIHTVRGSRTARRRLAAARSACSAALSSCCSPLQPQRFLPASLRSALSSRRTGARASFPNLAAPPQTLSPSRARPPCVYRVAAWACPAWIGRWRTRGGAARASLRCATMGRTRLWDGIPAWWPASQVCFARLSLACLLSLHFPRGHSHALPLSSLSRSLALSCSVSTSLSCALSTSLSLRT